MESLSMRSGGGGGGDGGGGNVEAVPEFWHFFVAIYFGVGFFLSRFVLDRFVFQKIAVWLLSIGSASLKVNDATRAKIVKCKESLWKWTYYASCEIFLLKVIYQEPWFRDTQQYFLGWPNQELKSPLKIYYMCQCGFYLYSVAALLIWETRRKDFAVMMSHHIITIILISFSFLTRFFRVGSIILALHDASDVFMESAKVFKYSENELGASVCFGLFAVSWLLLRLIYFPFWVIWSTSVEVGGYVNVLMHEGMAMYYSFNTMLLMLLVFHVYWWYLICVMIMRQLKNKGKIGEDIRSDSEDED